MRKHKETSGPNGDDGRDHLLEKVAAVSRRMDSMEEIVGSLADANDGLKTKMLGKFGKSRRRAQVFLALDGIRDANAVAKLVRTQRQNVDVEIRTLWKSRLIDTAESNGRGVIYRKRSIDRFTGLSDDLMEIFNLDRDGRIRK